MFSIDQSAPLFFTEVRPVTETTPTSENTAIHEHEEVQQAAEALFFRHPDWVTFYREILGRQGLIRRVCPTLESLAEFKQTRAYQEIQRMLSELRRRSTLPPPAEEITRVITVRIPKSLHEGLQAEAHQHETSMNKLCISKLLQLIDHQMVPTEQEGQTLPAG
jgi:predicted HicB family RNase H-like nuclease